MRAKILIVDDDDDLRIALSMRLETKGYAVHAVKNAKEAARRPLL